MWVHQRAVVVIGGTRRRNRRIGVGHRHGNGRGRRGGGRETGGARGVGGTATSHGEHDAGKKRRDSKSPHGVEASNSKSAVPLLLEGSSALAFSYGRWDLDDVESPAIAGLGAIATRWQGKRRPLPSPLVVALRS